MTYPSNQRLHMIARAAQLVLDAKSLNASLVCCARTRKNFAAPDNDGGIYDQLIATYREQRDGYMASARLILKELGIANEQARYPMRYLTITPEDAERWGLNDRPQYVKLVRDEFDATPDDQPPRNRYDGIHSFKVRLKGHQFVGHKLAYKVVMGGDQLRAVVALADAKTGRDHMLSVYTPVTNDAVLMAYMHDRFLPSMSVDEGLRDDLMLCANTLS